MWGEKKAFIMLDASFLTQQISTIAKEKEKPIN